MSLIRIFSRRTDQKLKPEVRMTVLLLLYVVKLHKILAQRNAGATRAKTPPRAKTSPRAKTPSRATTPPRAKTPQPREKTPPKACKGGPPVFREDFSQGLKMFEDIMWLVVWNIWIICPIILGIIIIPTDSYFSEG